MAKTASKPATTKAVANWDARLAQYAEESAATEQTSGGKFVSIRGGRLSYGGAEVPGNKMSVIILDHIMENHLYTERFDPDTPVSPACFAFGRKEDEMGPHENSTEPQASACKGCPMNEFGTADTGKGKACKNIRRLALIPEDGLDDLENAEIAYLKVPVMSVKTWAGYVQSVANNLKRPPFGVVTEISVVPDPKSQFRLTFTVGESIEDAAVLEALIKRREQVAKEIDFPYQPYTAPEAPPARGVGKGAPKVGGAKPAAKFARR